MQSDKLETKLLLRLLKKEALLLAKPMLQIDQLLEALLHQELLELEEQPQLAIMKRKRRTRMAMSIQP